MSINQHLRKKIKPVVNTKGKVQYYYNDLSTTSLKQEINLPQNNTKLKISVLNFAGANKKLTRVQTAANNAYCSSCFTLNYFNNFYAFPKWSSVSILKIVPASGRDLNAYYDRSALRFFFDKDPRNKPDIYLADSSEVVAHEMGHALLDILRPEFFDAVSSEIWAFHESFGDIIAILNSLQHDIILNELIKVNLKKSNIVSRLAENLGEIIHYYDSSYPTNALRDAVNTFNYVDPKELSDDTPDNKLSSEPHNFSRIMTGCVYDILIGIYQEQAKSKDALTALKSARDIVTNLMIKTAKLAPATVHFYDSFARTMINVNKSVYKRANEDIIKSAFNNRKILKTSLMALSNMTIKDVKPTNIIHFKDRIVVHTDEMRIVKPDFGIRALSVNPLMNLKVSVPYGASYEFTKSGRLIEKNKASEDEIKKDLHKCLHMIHCKGECSSSPNTMFEMKHKRLFRSHFRCCGIRDNSENPQAPEFNKPYKPENHSGCCGHCKKKEDVVATPVKTRGCFIRYNSSKKC